VNEKTSQQQYRTTMMRRRKRRRRMMMTMMMMTMMTMTMMMTAPGNHCLIAHIMIWMSLPEKETKHPLEMTLVGRWQHCNQLNIW